MATIFERYFYAPQKSQFETRREYEARLEPLPGRAFRIPLCVPPGLIHYDAESRHWRIYIGIDTNDDSVMVYDRVGESQGFVFAHHPEFSRYEKYIYFNTGGQITNTPLRSYRGLPINLKSFAAQPGLKLVRTAPVRVENREYLRVTVPMPRLTAQELEGKLAVVLTVAFSTGGNHASQSFLNRNGNLVDVRYLRFRLLELIVCHQATRKVFRRFTLP